MRHLPLALVTVLALAPIARAQGIDVAVLGADSSNAIADVQATLLADPRVATADDIDVLFSTPTLATLLAYDTVIIWRRQPSAFFDTTGLGDVLADFVLNGGGVVECFGSGHASSALLGNWSGTYNCSNPNAFLPFTGTYTMGTVQNPAHPIMAGVSAFTTSASAYYNASAPMPWTTTIASYTTGIFLVAENTNTAKVVFLNFFPVSETVGPPAYSLSGDGALMVQNAVAYVGPVVPTGPQLALQGSCGQTGSAVLMSGATPGGAVALAYGFGSGAAVVAGGPACVGTVTGLDQIILALRGFADANGDYTFVGPGNRVPANACGLVSLQGADVTTCAVTNVLAL